MANINDVNDALNQGHTLAELENTADIMEVKDPNNVRYGWAKEGMEDIKATIAETLENRDGQPLTDLMEDVPRMNHLAWAYIFFEKDVGEILDNACKIYGIKTCAKFLKRKLLFVVRKKRKEQENKKIEKVRKEIPKHLRPHLETLCSMKRKLYKDKMLTDY